MPTIEQALDQLFQRVEALEAESPKDSSGLTIATVGVDGSITFSFTGHVHATGLDLDEANTVATPINKIQWIDAAGNVREQIWASSNGALDTTNLEIESGFGLGTGRTSVNIDLLSRTDLNHLASLSIRARDDLSSQVIIGMPTAGGFNLIKDDGTSDWRLNSVKIVDADIAAAAAIAGAKLAAGSVADDRLASPNNSAYKTIQTVFGTGGRLQAAGTRWFAPGGGAGPNITTITQGTDLAATARSIPVFFFAAADYAVPGKTTVLRIRFQVGVNGTAPGIIFTCDLRPVTWTGGVDIIIPTAGGAVGSSGVAIATPAANSVNSAVNADFAIPADGHYGLAVTYSGAMPANATVHFSAQLQVRNV